jgi:hypothetical protein
MPFTGKVGDSFKFPDAGGKHRYIIITTPNEDGNVVIINFTSDRSWKDTTTTFSPRDDKDIFSGHTVVNYNDARLVSLKHLLKVYKKSRNPEYKFCNTRIMERIIDGALRTKFIPQNIQNEIIRCHRS